LHPRAHHSFPTRRSSDLGRALTAFAAHGEQEHPAHHAEDSACHCCLRYEVFCCARHTTSMPNPRVSTMASTGEMNTRAGTGSSRSEEHTSELQSRSDLVC